MFDEQTFYDMVRESLFNGRISDDQFEGLSKVLTYYTEVSGWDDLRWLAYLYATDYHETAYTMQPIMEYGSLSYLESKPYYPFYGRGLVQLTWEENYAMMGSIFGEDYVGDPDKVMLWEHAVPIIFEGMTHGVSKRGDFTGKSLEDYFNDTRDDAKGARAIINGTDCADEIAKHHEKFLAALEASWLEAEV